MIDGLRFNQSTFRTGPNQYLDTIGLSAISDVDTINGPAGLLFGSNAIGGVINLKTQGRLADYQLAIYLLILHGPEFLDSLKQPSRPKIQPFVWV